MKRSGFIKRKARIKSHKRINAINRTRAAKKSLRNFGTKPFREFTKRQPCLICGEAPRKWWYRDSWGNDMAHTEARGMGGCGGDWTTIIPACPPCHDAGLVEGRSDLAEQHQARWCAHIMREAA